MYRYIIYGQTFEGFRFYQKLKKASTFYPLILKLVIFASLSNYLILTNADYFFL